MLYIRRLVDLWAEFSLKKRKLTKNQRLNNLYTLLKTDVVFPTKFKSQYKTLDDMLYDSNLILYYLQKNIKTKKESKYGSIAVVYRDRFLGGKTSEEAIRLIKENHKTISKYFTFEDTLSNHPYQVTILAHKLLREHLQILRTLGVEDEVLQFDGVSQQ